MWTPLQSPPLLVLLPLLAVLSRGGLTGSISSGKLGRL